MQPEGQRKWPGARAAAWLFFLLCLWPCKLPSGVRAQTAGSTSPPQSSAKLGAPQVSPPPGAPNAPPAQDPILMPRQADGNGSAASEQAPGLDAPVLPIDLGTALRLAATNNLDIAQAQLVVNQAKIQVERTR